MQMPSGTIAPMNTAIPLRRLGFAAAIVCSCWLGIASGAAPSIVDGPELKWDVSLWGKPRAGTVVADALAAAVEEKTGGKWRLALHYGEALSKARENLDGLEIGAFEAAMFCNFYHPRKNPALMALTLPFLPMNSWEEQPPYPRSGLRASSRGAGTRPLERDGVHVVLPAAVRVPGPRRTAH